jgi:uncharacterized damage-inducible protein DinB
MAFAGNYKQQTTVFYFSMDKREEILRIVDQFNLTYESEEAWHGPSVVEILRDVSWEMANERMTNNTHSIAEVVYHMTSWRIFTVKKLQGDKTFDVTREKDWKTFPIFDEFEWEALQMELSLSQEELMNELEKLEDDEFLDEVVPGREYDYYTMLHGIIQHDLYHCGQISILKKALVYKGFDKKGAKQDEEYFGSNSYDDDMY